MQYLCKHWWKHFVKKVQTSILMLGPSARCWLCNDRWHPQIRKTSTSSARSGWNGRSIFVLQSFESLALLHLQKVVKMHNLDLCLWSSAIIGLRYVRVIQISARYFRCFAALLLRWVGETRLPALSFRSFAMILLREFFGTHASALSFGLLPFLFGDDWMKHKSKF